MTRSIGRPLSVLLLVCFVWVATVPVAHGAITTCTVNTTADDPATASATVNVATNAGTLRDCILVANLLTGSTGAPTLPGLTITFSAALSGATIALSDALPLLFNNTVIDASALANPVGIDGGSAHRIFFVSGLPSTTTGLVNGKPNPDGAQAITVTLRNLKLEHGLAKGGDTFDSGNGAGGGGMGAGGALFVNQLASVILDHVSFTGNAAQGGSQISGSGAGAGGGGMGPGLSHQGGGGLGAASLSGGGAGIGTGGTAGSASGGWGGQGLGQISNVQGFNPVFLDVDNGSGTPGLGLIGGGTSYPANGFGGVAGFGGGASVEGKGGFGGGGGEGQGHDSGGGFGGGSGAQGFAAGGFGGGGGQSNFLNGGVGGGAHGGGAGFGGAVFVRTGGSLTIQNSSATGSVSGGNLAAGTGTNNGAAAGSGLFLMTGATTSFDIAGKYTVGDTLADDSLSTLPAAQSYTAGNGAGAAITKQGTGTLVLSGVNTYAGATSINAGILRVTSPGNIKSSQTSVAAAGTLTGDGTVGIVDSFGTIAPGTGANPQGTLHVIGALHLQLGALTCFHADGANAVSDISMTGAATLNGIARIDFSGSPTVGMTYFPLSASSVSGTFAGYETNMPNLLGHFTYGATSVTFTVDASDVVFRNGLEQSINDSPCIAAFAN